MKWPGTTDPYKRKQMLRFLMLSTIMGIVAVVITMMVVNPLIGEQPRNACIDNIDTNWKIQFTVEITVDGVEVQVPANVGFTEDCQRAIYTLADDGIVYAEWIEDPGFEIGHFMWIYEIPLRDMNQEKSVIYVNDRESPHFSHHSLQDGYHYKIDLVTKDYDDFKDRDFQPPEK